MPTALDSNQNTGSSVNFVLLNDHMGLAMCHVVYHSRSGGILLGYPYTSGEPFNILADLLYTATVHVWTTCMGMASVSTSYNVWGSQIDKIQC